MKILKPNLQIAIDGPVAAGKGTVSKLLAESLDILYVDTGAMYRAIAVFVKELDINFEDESLICDALEKNKPEVRLRRPKDEEKDGRLVTVLLNNEDISWVIRTEEISRGVSIITRYNCVRSYMVPQQQKIAQDNSVVMEGRDITTRVLPDADLKIYLDASVEDRIERRYKQLLQKGQLVERKNVAEDLKKRDHRDMTRNLDPLTKAPDAWVLDTTNLTITQTIETICDNLRKKGLIE